MLSAAPSGPNTGIRARFSAIAAANATAELIRFSFGRSIMRIVSPSPTNAFSAQATATIAAQEPPIRNDSPKIVIIAPPAIANTATTGNKTASIQRARYP